MEYTRLDAITGQEVYVARHLRGRKFQCALIQYFKPENNVETLKALMEAGRQELIVSGCDALLPAQPPKAALEARRGHSIEAAHGDHYHAVANPARGEPPGELGLPNPGSRPGRKSARRQGTSAKRKGGPSRPHG
jgi:hypothetical protein